MLSVKIVLVMAWIALDKLPSYCDKLVLFAGKYFLPSLWVIFYVLVPPLLRLRSR